MTIFRKSLLTLGITAFILVSVFVISVLAFMNFLYYETNARALHSAASTIFSLYTEDRLREYFDEGIKGKNFPFGEKQFRLTLIGINGDVLWDSHVTERMVNHLDREEVYAALEGKEGHALRNSTSAGKRTLYAALPVKSADGTVMGVFRLTTEVPSFWQRIAPAALRFLLLVAVLVCAAFAGIFYFSRSLSFSLHRLVDIALEVGDFRYADTGAGETEELQTLENALRSMSMELKLRLEEASRESKKLEAILNSMSEAVIAMDNDLSLLLLNPCARELFNLKGRSVQKISLLEATRSTELEWAGRKVAETGKPEKIELSFHFNGVERRFQISITPFSSDTSNSSLINFSVDSGFGASGGIVMVMEDVTRTNKLEQVRRDFVANVSHELRTPIQVMKGFSETLLDSPLVALHKESSAGQEQLRHYIEIIQKNSVVMENLINDLLSLASLEDESQSRPDREELSLAPLFAEAAASVEIQAKKKQTVIVADCPPEVKAPLYGSFIVQALVNLLDNAIKYSPNASEVLARACKEGNNLVLEVKDQGMGIPAEHQERIFERFYRVDRARSRDAGGTGLGLAIVRHIALLHGGRAEVESRAGEGSVFRVIIPE